MVQCSVSCSNLGTPVMVQPLPPCQVAMTQDMPCNMCACNSICIWVKCIRLPVSNHSFTECRTRTVLDIWLILDAHLEEYSRNRAQRVSSQAILHPQSKLTRLVTFAMYKLRSNHRLYPYSFYAVTAKSDQVQLPTADEVYVVTAKAGSLWTGCDRRRPAVQGSF